MTRKVFTPPSPLTLEVGISRDSYKRRLLRTIDGISYEWKHNESENLLQDIRIKESILRIPQTRSQHAGNYSVEISSFGFSKFVDKTCADLVLNVLEHYAVLQGVTFQTINGKIVARLACGHVLTILKLFT